MSWLEDFFYLNAFLNSKSIDTFAPEGKVFAGVVLCPEHVCILVHVFHFYVCHEVKDS